jgi:hypothetical protein
MAWTEAQLNAQLDPTGTDKSIDIIRLIPGPTVTSVYAIGITAPYAGCCGWFDLTTAQTDAQAASQLQTLLQV